MLVFYCEIRFITKNLTRVYMCGYVSKPSVTQMGDDRSYTIVLHHKCTLFFYVTLWGIQLFQIEFLNMFDGASNVQPRTNNSMEAFHKALQIHNNLLPNIWRLIGCLWRENALASKRLVDLRMGGDDRKKNYRHINDKLENIVKCYVPKKK